MSFQILDCGAAYATRDITEKTGKNLIWTLDIDAKFPDLIIEPELCKTVSCS